MTENILTIRSPLVTFYVLKDGDSLYVIDGGFIGGQKQLEHALKKKGWHDIPIRGIIATHGHLDHILNVASLARTHSAWIAAPVLDAAHYAGVPRYSGWARVTALLEACGRKLLKFEPFTPDHFLSDGEILPIWNGLQTIALPGHTHGQIGLLCLESRLLFSADLFASYRAFPHLPPRIFNHDQRLTRLSLRSALEMTPSGVLPNHGTSADPKEHLDRLRSLATRLRV